MIVKLNGKNVTKLVQSLNMSNSIDTLSTTVSISFPFYKNTKFLVEVKVGDKLEIDHIFQGIVVDCVYDKESTEIKAFDIAFYLSKNMILKQIRNTAAKEGIKAICSELGIPINIKSGLDTKVNLMFKNKSASDSIVDIIKEDTKQTGKEYFIYTLNNKVYIEELGNEEVALSFKLNDAETFKGDKLLSEKVVSENIEELKNSILVLSDDNKSLKVLAKNEDSGSINKYGKLQEVVELNSKENKKAKSVASTTLNSLNKIKKVVNVNLITDTYVISGKKIKLENVDYLIKSVNLDFENGAFKGNLELKELV
ncbi:XkdQ/YqbQ family protein [Streptobacillus canis]|uniref:XkdQ/YqbQ family protein n=1 Tax=Streptobacillus canis TaxID=2678686 RepID=UPI0012E0D5D7|nr:hypothetical protein [Streptobacillus canis]